MIGDFAPAIDLLKKEIPGLAGVYLFGSEATGAARAGSDVDLAIFAGRPIAQPLLRETAEAIARLLLREVDLVDLAAADTILQMQVLREGIVLAECDPVALGHFELRILRDYRDLKIRRAGIEADIVKRGRVYADDVIIAKAAIIERCVERARAEFAASGEDVATDYTRQDAAILNVERACDAAIDIADRIVRLRGLGAPSSARDSLAKLVAAGIIEQTLADRLMRMVGFRNLAVHQYQKLDLAIVAAVIERSLDDVLAFAALSLGLR